MRFILDASIVITWAMADEIHPVADLAFHEIQSGSVIVPGIFWYEIQNILVLNERRNRISITDSSRFLREFEQFSIQTVYPQDWIQIMDLSRNYKLSVYDAAYLALAIRDRLPLATLDKELRAAAQIAGVSLLA
jgi:predicted nucleic acid-binding protein